MFDKNKFKYYVAERNMTLGDVAKHLGINGSTLTRKMNGGGDFYRSEIQTIASVLSLTDRQVQEVFFC